MKFTIPREDRTIALKQLDDYNISHYTLFQTTEALIRTTALRVFEIRDT